MSSANPPQETSANVEIVKIKDVSKTIAQNINPLIEDDLKKILVESTTQAKLCENLVLVSVDEIEKIDKVSIGEEVQTKETSTIPPQFTFVQPSLPIVVYQRKESATSTVSALMQGTLVSVNIQENEDDKGETVGEHKDEIEKNEGTQVLKG